MTKLLSQPAVDRYRRDGFLFPIPVLTTDEAHDHRRQLEAAETTELRHKPHLLFTWLADLVRHPTILDAAEDVLGPNLLVWHSSFFIKERTIPRSSPGTRTRPTGASASRTS